MSNQTSLRIAPAGYRRALHSLILQYISIYKRFKHIKPNLYPYMDLCNKQTGFHPENSITDASNPWINYFEQRQNIDITNIIDTEKEENDDSILLYNLQKNDLLEYNSIIKDILHIKPFILDIVNNFVQKNFNNNVVGIHIRGTDSFFDKGRPSIPLQYYIDLIQTKLSKYDKIFISTDTIGVIEKLIKLFGKRIITYSSIKTTINYHYLALHENNNNPFQVGLEVLVDSLLLSKCNLLIRQQSNITTFSILYNPTIKVHQFDLPLWSSENYHISNHSSSYVNTTKNYYVESLQLDNINSYIKKLKIFNTTLEEESCTLYKYTENNKKLMGEYFYN